jgi:hypothetical protein
MDEYNVHNSNRAPFFSDKKPVRSQR